VALGAVAVLAACSSNGSAATEAETSVVSTVSTSPPTTADLTTTSTLAPTTTTEPLPADFLGEEVIGTSVEGRPITAWHRGTEGGTVVLVVGVIHGDEDAGLPILDRLAEVDLPAGLDLWVMPALNPDGVANQMRGNGNGVDLNRNFPHDWTAIAAPGEWQFSGSGPASEPETQAFIEFSSRIAPELTLWYHQDLFCLTPSKGRDRPLREAYSRITGLPIVAVTGGIYTGVAATWVRRTLDDAMSFIVELGPTVPDDERERHVQAVLEVSTMVVNGEV
jgi:protein MpaA